MEGTLGGSALDVAPRQQGRDDRGHRRSGAKPQSLKENDKIAHHCRLLGQQSV